MPRKGGLPRVRGSRPPRRRPRNPATCPSTAGSGRGRRRAPCSAAKWRRLSSGSSANGGMVMRPLTRTGALSRKAGSSSGAMPALPSSPATLTSTRISVSGVPCFSSCRSADSEATEWMSSTYGRICLTLRLWSWPMKCQRKPGCASALASSSCARFSPSSVSPASSSTWSSSSATYLTAASSSISAGSRPARFAASAISASTRSRPLRTVSTSRPVIRPATRPPPAAR